VFLDPSTYLWNASDQSIFRPGGVFGSPPGAATVLTVVIICGVALLYMTHGRVKTLVLVCLGICGLALISTFTRAGFIAVSLGIFALLWLVRAPITRRPLRMAWIVAAIAVVIFAALPLVQRNSTFRYGVLRSGLGQSTLTVRESYWKLALPIATRDVHNFLFGIGTSSLETPSISNQAAVLPDMARAPQVYVNSLHNQYVTTLVEQGAVGLVLLVLLLVSAGARASGAALRTRDPVFAAAAASVLALAVTMLADTALLHAPSFAMLMLALGLAASAPSSGNSRVRRALVGA
jgi:O-antigen ligase